MNKKSVSKFSLSYYSLTTQIIIINFFTAIIILIFVGVFNLFLLKNNKSIEQKTQEIATQINDIKNYLQKNAIIRIPQFNEKNGELIFSAEPQLDPFASQLYIENRYLNQPNEIKIYNKNLIKYVDTKDLYLVEEVLEIDIDSDIKKINFFQKYKEIYLALFNNLQSYFDRKKINEIAGNKKNDINLIAETIKKQEKIIRIFSNENNILSINTLIPLKKNNNIYGAILVKGFLNQEKNQAALVSFNLFNFFLIIIFFMFLFSILFTRSIIRPIKKLSSLVMYEQNKYKNSNNKLQYPIRNDEIGNLSQDIENMSRKLKLRINELENFAADVAHELKNPLSSLKSSSELLSENKIKSEDKKLLFENINFDLNRMNKLISDISEYTRTQAEVEKQKFNVISLNELIYDLISSLSNNKKGIKILSELSHEKIIVQTNANKLAQVFINLLENSISFSPIKSKILIRQIKENNNVVVYVADQGIGINFNLSKKIFERFYTDRKEKSGYHTGLGLSISKNIIESFGGSLKLNKKIINGYNGACFKMKLPLKA